MGTVLGLEEPLVQTAKSREVFMLPVFASPNRPTGLLGTETPKRLEVRKTDIGVLVWAVVAYCIEQRFSGYHCRGGVLHHPLSESTDYCTIPLTVSAELAPICGHPPERQESLCN